MILAEQTSEKAASVFGTMNMGQRWNGGQDHLFCIQTTDILREDQTLMSAHDALAHRFFLLIFWGGILSIKYFTKQTNQTSEKTSLW